MKSLCAIALLFSLGCSARKPIGPSLVIPPECMTKPAIVKNCDEQLTHCKGPAIVTYKAGCGSVSVHHNGDANQLTASPSGAQNVEQ